MYLILKHDLIHPYLDKSKTRILGRREYLDQNTVLATEYLQFTGTYPYDPEPSFPDDEELPSTSYGSPEHVLYLIWGAPRNLSESEGNCSGWWGDLFDSEGNCSWWWGDLSDSEDKCSAEVPPWSLILHYHPIIMTICMIVWYFQFTILVYVTSVHLPSDEMQSMPYYAAPPTTRLNYVNTLHLKIFVEEMDVSRRILVIDTSIFIHFRNK